MRPDKVLITCEAWGLHHAQATQASSSHIVIDLAAVLRVPARAPYDSDDVFPCFFVGDSEMALGTCPACAGRHRPHTYAEGCKKKKESIASGAVAPPTVPPVPSLSPARVLAGPPLEGSSDGPRPPGLEPPLGVSSDDSSPHERSEGNLQKPKKNNLSYVPDSFSLEESSGIVEVAS